MAKTFCYLMLALSIAGTWSLAAASTATEPERELLFRVMLDDKEIGLHSFRVRREDQREVVDIRADFDIKFLAITFYSYDHENRETWENGCLDSIVSSTDDNGDEFRVEGRDRGASFELATQDGKVELDSQCVMSFAYWNSEFLNQPRLLNAQNGEYLAVEVNSEGVDELELGDRSIAARRYRLRNPEQEIDITVWYGEETGQWVSLESRVEGGRVIRYLPIEQSVLQPRASLDSVGRRLDEARR